MAAYFYFTPVYLLKPEGGIFGCGSPASPNSESVNICGAPEGVSRARAYAALGLGLLVIVLGFALFGLGGVGNDPAHDEMDDEMDDDDIDLRSHSSQRAERSDAADQSEGRGLRAGNSNRRLRSEFTSERDEPIDHERDVPESRSARSESGRRPLRDKDFAEESRRHRPDDGTAERTSRRRRDDDWESDGWR
ncbi:hypothetical protein [Janibacter sp. LM]|uniref:hypothetical protein n=1 Tax=Janibacter sp. LM TaxID=3144845 RepID=UPI0031F68ED6